MNNPARLNKIEEDDSILNGVTDYILGWALANPKLVFIILFITLAGVMALLFNVVYGMCTIESGVMRNFMANGV